MRRINPEDLIPLSAGNSGTFTDVNQCEIRRRRLTSSDKRNVNLTIMQSNLASFIAWGLPAFQTAAVIVARLVDADELIGK